eukprot:TRINITY_DN4181_c1_g1_i1.p1 TRINITY_DN4181_c1_g1~~TRINITY_DN4181_c1_g1_i1.p1  ORF type:complete len:2022 (+),score=462.95 TRINITY_DN4181_c1_g1_i1:170-6235(+)
MPGDDTDEGIKQPREGAQNPTAASHDGAGQSMRLRRGASGAELPSPIPPTAHGKFQSAEAAIAEKEQCDLKSLFEAAKTLVIGVDEKRIVTHWTPAAATLSRCSRADAIGKPLSTALKAAGDDREALSDIVARALKGEETAGYELVLEKDDHPPQEVLIHAIPCYGPGGKVIGAVAVGHDVTETRRTTAERRRETEDLHRLIETANAPIFGIDTEGKVTEWNRKAALITGFTKQDTCGSPFVESFIHKDYREEVGRVLTEALDGNETANFELPLFTRDGQRRVILLNATTRRGADGEVTGVIGVGQDITDFRQVLSEQQRIAEDLSVLIASANAPIFGVDASGCLTEWNKKMEELSGFSKKETMGKRLVDEFVAADHKEKVQCMLDRSWEGEESVNVEFALESKDGQRIEILLNATPRRGTSGQVTGMVGVGQDITSLRKAMVQSTQVADDLTRLIDSANAPILGIDRSGNVTEWNRKAACISGYSKAETLGKPLVKTFISEEYRDEVHGVLQAALDGNETANYEFPLFTKNGERREILLNATSRLGPNGEVVGVIGVGQDITDFRALMTKTQVQADDLSRLIDNANAPIFGVDLNGFVTEWNTKAACISGWSRQQAISRDFVRDFIDPSHRQRVQDVLDRALGGEEVGNFELPLYSIDGQKRDILLNATPRKGIDGKIVGVVGVGQDITELNKQRSEADRRAAELQSIIDTAGAPIIGIDRDGCITEWNSSVQSATGHATKEALGKKFSHYVVQGCRAEVRKHLSAAFLGKSMPSFEVLVQSKKQEPVVFLLNVTPRLGSDNKIVGVICIGQDITHFKELEIKKSQFMATVTHELRSPLHGIIGLSDNLLLTCEKEKSGAKALDPKRPLKMINNCARRLLDLLTNIIDIQTLTASSKKTKLVIESVSMQRIVEEVLMLTACAVDKAGRPIQKPGVELFNNVKDLELPTIQADAHRCTQMLYNLVANALKFTERGHVTISANSDDEKQEMTIEVADTGVGIAPQSRELIFRPFEQEDQSESRRYEGLGLGLSISREVAVKHGGELAVESEVGLGSRFLVRLPYEATESAKKTPKNKQLVPTEQEEVKDVDGDGADLESEEEAEEEEEEEEEDDDEESLSAESEASLASEQETIGQESHGSGPARSLPGRGSEASVTTLDSLGRASLPKTRRHVASAGTCPRLPTLVFESRVGQDVDRRRSSSVPPRDDPGRERADSSRNTRSSSRMSSTHLAAAVSTASGDLAPVGNIVPSKRGPRDRQQMMAGRVGGQRCRTAGRRVMSQQDLPTVSSGGLKKVHGTLRSLSPRSRHLGFDRGQHNLEEELRQDEQLRRGRGPSLTRDDLPDPAIAADRRLRPRQFTSTNMHGHPRGGPAARMVTEDLLPLPPPDRPSSMLHAQGGQSTFEEAALASVLCATLVGWDGMLEKVGASMAVNFLTELTGSLEKLSAGFGLRALVPIAPSADLNASLAAATASGDKPVSPLQLASEAFVRSSSLVLCLAVSKDLDSVEQEQRLVRFGVAARLRLKELRGPMALQDAAAARLEISCGIDSGQVLRKNLARSPAQYCLLGNAVSGCSRVAEVACMFPGVMAASERSLAKLTTCAPVPARGSKVSSIGNGLRASELPGYANYFAILQADEALPDKPTQPPRARRVEEQLKRAVMQSPGSAPTVASPTSTSRRTTVDDFSAVAGASVASNSSAQEVCPTPLGPALSRGPQPFNSTRSADWPPGLPNLDRMAQQRRTSGARTVGDLAPVVSEATRQAAGSIKASGSDSGGMSSGWLPPCAEEIQTGADAQSGGTMSPVRTQSSLPPRGDAGGISTHDSMPAVAPRQVTNSIDALPASSGTMGQEPEEVVSLAVASKEAAGAAAQVAEAPRRASSLTRQKTVPPQDEKATQQEMQPKKATTTVSAMEHAKALQMKESQAQALQQQAVLRWQFQRELENMQRFCALLRQQNLHLQLGVSQQQRRTVGLESALQEMEVLRQEEQAETHRLELRSQRLEAEISWLRFHGGKGIGVFPTGRAA